MTLFVGKIHPITFFFRQSQFLQRRANRERETKRRAKREKGREITTWEREFLKEGEIISLQFENQEKKNRSSQRGRENFLEEMWGTILKKSEDLDRQMR